MFKPESKKAECPDTRTQKGNHCHWNGQLLKADGLLNFILILYCWTLISCLELKNKTSGLYKQGVIKAWYLSIYVVSGKILPVDSGMWQRKRVLT